MVTSAAVELVYAAGARTAEGPVWDAHAGRLRWVDIPVGEVHELDPATGTDSAFNVGRPVGAVIPRRRGGLLLVVDDGFATCSTDGTELTWVARVEVPAGGGRMNDGACDPTGRVWAGSMHPDTHGAATLYRLDEHAQAHAVLSGVSLSNGLGWSPDGSTFYYADTPTGRVDAFDVDLEHGALSARRAFTSVERGRPDGLCVDADGCVWVALWDGGAVQRFTPGGELDLTVEIPVAKVTSCAFGGSDLDTLFITTAKGGPTSPPSEPYAGAIFGVDPCSVGLPQSAWTG